MTVLKNLFLFLVLAITVYIIANTTTTEKPDETARHFLKKLQEGDLKQIVSEFGDNTCNCQPRGGYIAFLKYQSGEADNLSFLVGQKFHIDSCQYKYIPTQVKFKGWNLPWEKPESMEVNLRLTFEQAIFRPYFLPLNMAFGYPIKVSEIEEFLQNPAKNFSYALALRLRPTVKPGLIPPPDPKQKPQFTADIFLKLLPESQTRYLRPADASGVEIGDGKTVPAYNYASQLPRLKSVTLSLLVVRRSKYRRWLVKKGSLHDPLFQLANDTLIPVQNRDLRQDTLK